MTKKIKKRIGLQNNGCAGRWSCKNVDKSFCNPIPEMGKLFVECKFYKKIEENKFKKVK